MTSDWALPQTIFLKPFRSIAPALGPLLVGLVYYGGAEAAFAIGTLTQMFAPFWPPNVVLLCALLVVPERRWWAYLLAAFAAHFVAERGVAMPVPQLLVAFACNVAVALLNAVALRHFLTGPPWLGGLRKGSLYLLITVVLSPGVVAFVGGAEPIVGGGEPSKYPIFWWRWYLSNALGSLTLTPVFLTWLAESANWLTIGSRHRRLEAAALTLGLITACTIAFSEPTQLAATDQFLPALLYVPMPLMLWAAVRFGGRGASSAIFVVTVLALWHLMQGHGPFAAPGTGGSVVALQLFLAVISAPLILLATMVEELHRTHNRLAAVLDGVSDCFFMLNRDWRFTVVNPEAAAWFGESSPAAMIGRSCWERLSHFAEVASFLRDAMENGVPAHGEIASTVHPEKSIDVHVYPSADGVSVFYRDITERSAATHALRLGAKRLQLAQEAAGIGVWEWDIATKELYWSPETYLLYGLSPTVKGLSLYEEWRRVLHPEDRDWVDAKMQTFLKAHRPFALEFRILRDGETCCMLGRGKVIRDANGRAERLIGVNLDITDRKRMEAALRQSDERFRVMAETVPDILFTSSPEGGCDYISPRFHEYTGLTAAAASGFGWAEALHPDDKVCLLAARQLAAHTGESFEQECRIRAVDGTFRWYVIRSHPLHDAMGKTQKWFGAITDVDDLKRGADELRKLTVQLLATQDGERRRIARDLHDSTVQDLAAVQLNIDRALRLAPNIADPARSALQESRQLVEQSQREIRTLSYLLHPPMLDEAGLPSALRWYVEGFSKRSGISVVLQVSPELHKRRLPTEVETALFRVVQEGLSNVHRHSGSSTARIRLKWEHSRASGKQFIALEIADEGRGILAKAEPVFAGGGLGSREAPALGVGLAGMRERVRQLGGRLDIASNESGMSARAIVPLDDEHRKTSRRAPR